jgi:putative DNA primase/helicase
MATISKEELENKENIRPLPNFISIVPKQGSSAASDFTTKSTQDKLNGIEARWKGGKKLAYGKYENPDHLYRAIPIEKKEDLLSLFDELDIDPAEVDLKEVYIPVLSPNLRKAKNVRNSIDKDEQEKNLLEMEKIKKIHEAEVRNGEGLITDEDLEKQIKEIREKYQPRIDKLSITILKKEGSESQILQEGICGEEPSNTFPIEPGLLHEASNHGIKILSDPSCGVFQQKGRLIRIVSYQKKKPKKDSLSKKESIHRDEGALMLQPVDEVFLTKILSEKQTWTKYAEREKRDKPIDFPEKGARYILADFSSSKDHSIPYLKGFVCCPTIREDGSILQTPGYDEESGLYFDPCGTVFPHIPENPTRKEGIAALELLKDLLKDVPFSDDVSLSVAIAEIMTGVIRRSLNLALFFQNDASTPGSGKTLLALVVALIATGKAPAMLAPSPDTAEMEKRYGASLMAGDPILCIDNVDFVLEDRNLCLIATTEEWDTRILGKSQNAKVDTNALFIFTGNNFSIRGDLASRFLKCRIVPKEEHPEERKFDRNLKVYARENRGILVAAALTIIRAYICAGSPKLALPECRDFDDFTRFVRAPLVWLGAADPYESTRDINENNPETEILGGLFSAWYEAIKHFAIENITVKKLINLKALDTDKPEKKMAAENLRQFLLENFPNKNGDIDPLKLGETLSKSKDRTVNGLKAQRHIGANGKPVLNCNAVQWKILKAN